MNRVEALTAWFEYQKTATNEFSLPLLPFLLQLIVYALAYFDLKKYTINPQTNRQTFGFGPLLITVLFLAYKKKTKTLKKKMFPQKIKK